MNISDVAEIGGRALLDSAGASSSALELLRRVFLTAGAAFSEAAACTTESTVAGVLAVTRLAAGLATVFAGAFAAAALAVAALLTGIEAVALLAGFEAVARADGFFVAGALPSTASGAIFLVAKRLTGFFESAVSESIFFDSMLDAFESFLFTISGALQAACAWATLTSC